MTGKNEITLKNGITIWWEDNGVGGRRYYSDECGNGVLVWDTCLVSLETIDEVMKKEFQLTVCEAVESMKKIFGDKDETNKNNK